MPKQDSWLHNLVYVEMRQGQAVDWYRKAAEQGNAKAQFNLGFMYFDRLGVLKD
jgi:TPR repeat protein